MQIQDLNFKNIRETTAILNREILDPLLNRYNNEYAPLLLFHLPDESIQHGQYTKVRGRIGLLIEYAVITILHEMVFMDSNNRCLVTFNTANMFADFYIREGASVPFLRFDVKVFQGSSDEASNRFTTRIEDIEPEKDYLLYAKWEWKETESHLGRVIIPYIEKAAIVSCIAMAEERNRRQIITDGGFDTNGIALNAKGNRDTNLGKLARIIHGSRWESADLDPYVKKAVSLVEGDATIGQMSFEYQ